ncbi:hypothetical protein [Enorma burkinafasonensis]|nr:hypothetical protein [Enorma burkinafasonensis]MCI7730078.1 hypothetical protein [Enorma burkinafasonensis]
MSTLRYSFATSCANGGMGISKLSASCVFTDPVWTIQAGFARFAPVRP